MARKRTRPKPSKKRKPTNREIKARDEALRTLNLMRTKHISLAIAARQRGTRPKTVIKHVGKALTKQPNGRYKAKPSDRLLRHMKMMTDQGPVSIPVRGSRLASKIATYSNAVQRYLETGQTDALQPFADKSVKVGKVKYPFITDTRLLNRLGRAGEVSFEDLYAR